MIAPMFRLTLFVVTYALYLTLYAVKLSQDALGSKLLGFMIYFMKI